MEPDFVAAMSQAVKQIGERMKDAQDRKKSYADTRRIPLEFDVAPMKGVMRFGRKGKLHPRFIGPYEILERIGNVTYRLALPLQILGVHNVFYVSMLKKYIADPSHVLQSDPVQHKENLIYEEKPVQI